MTPLQIQIILHHYARSGEYLANSQAAREAIAWMKSDGLLEQSKYPQPPGCSSLVITERGRVYVEALKAVKLPVQTWVMPT